MSEVRGRVLKLLSYKDALMRLSNIFCNKVPEYEVIPVHEALGRIAAEDIFANVNIPENNISLVDGFALNYEDALSASPEKPVKLSVISKLYPWSDPASINISSGQACYVTCGTPIPSGANAVVKIENTLPYGEEILLQML